MSYSVVIDGRIVNVEPSQNPVLCVRSVLAEAITNAQVWMGGAAVVVDEAGISAVPGLTANEQSYTVVWSIPDLRDVMGKTIYEGLTPDDDGRYDLPRSTVEFCVDFVLNIQGDDGFPSWLSSAAHTRVSVIPELDQHSDTIFSDWPCEPEHLYWVLCAPAAEIVSWAEEIESAE